MGGIKHRAFLVGICLLAFSCSTHNKGTGKPSPAPDVIPDAAMAPSDSGSADMAQFVTADHMPLPQIPLNPGDPLSAMQIVSIVASDDPNATAISAYVDALIASHWWDKVGAEYGALRPTRHLQITGATLSGIDFSQGLGSWLQPYINDAISRAPADAMPNGHTLYLTFLPHGTMCANIPNIQLHGALNGYEGDMWAVALQCGTGANTLIASQQVIDVATNPRLPMSLGYQIKPTPGMKVWMGPVWVALGGQVGDLCAEENPITEGMYSYVRVWSNQEASANHTPCVPADPAPYFNVSPAQSWTAVAADSTVTVELTGWSLGPVSNWALAKGKVLKAGGYTDSFTSSLSGPNTVMLSGGTFPSVNNGTTASISVTAPATAQSGYWEVIMVSSFDDSGQEQHGWPVGFYVP